MTALTDDFPIALDVEEASWACRQAIADIGWDIALIEPRHIVPKVGAGATRNPSRIEVWLSPDGDSTTVRFEGTIRGMGPVQKRHLTGEMNRLRNAIELAARKATTT